MSPEFIPKFNDDIDLTVLKNTYDFIAQFIILIVKRIKLN